MRQIINIITIAFVAFTIFFAVRSDAVQKFAKEYFAEVRSELVELANGKEPTLAPIPEVVTPGPLTKIPTGKAEEPKPAAAPRPQVLTVAGVIARTNSERVRLEASPLVESKALDASAKVKAEDILARQYFEHVAPDGRSVSDLVADEEYAYIKIGENLALGNFADDADVVTAWMNSPGHKANIVDAQFTEIGVGIASGTYKGRFVYVAVQHFGRPRSVCPLVETKLKLDVEAGQAKLADDAVRLQEQKAAIDRGQKEGKEEREAIEAYNRGVDAYQAEYLRVEALRIEYNAEVNAFNTCVNPSAE
jgi:uncharacterized protein YkwD